MSLLPGKLHIQRRSVWAVMVFFLLCYYMLLPVNSVFLNAIRDSYYVCTVPILVVAVLYYHYHRLPGTLEYRFLLAFWIWFWFSRALNGSPLLDHDFRLFFDLALILPFFALGSALTRAERIRFLDWLSAVVGGFYFVLGLIALTAFLHRSMYALHLIPAAHIGIVREAGFARINYFDIHANITAYWYLFALFLMIYQFFHCEKKFWRIPIVLSATIDFLVIAITYSRSVRVCMAITFSLVSLMLLLRLLRSKPRFLRIAVVFPISVFVMVAAYEGSALCADVMALFSYQVTGIQAPSEAVWQNTVPKEAVQEGNNHSIHPVLLSSGKNEAPAAANLRSGLVQSDPRKKTGDLNTLSSNRVQIWLGAFQAIKTMPSILWRGHLCDSIMPLAHQFMTPDGEGAMPVHFHNLLIQILMTTGLPGLILTLFFLIRMFYQGTRLFLCVSAPLSVLTLVIPVLATMPYYMLEACSFMDIRILFLLLMCGLMLGYAGEYNGA